MFILYRTIFDRSLLTVYYAIEESLEGYFAVEMSPESQLFYIITSQLDLNL